MKLSVIMPVLNGERYIASQMEALANQEWNQPWEVIIADNGSSDQTLNIVKEFSKRFYRLVIIDASAQKGPAYARNYAARHATSASLAFCDHDDEVARGWVTMVGEALQNSDLVTGPLEFDKLNSVNYLKIPIGSELISVPFPPNYKVGCTCNLGCKYSLFQELKGFDESSQVAEDWDFCCSAQLLGYKLTWLPGMKVHYRLRDNLGDIFKRHRHHARWYVFFRKKFENPSLSLSGEIYSIFKELKHATFGLLKCVTNEDRLAAIAALGDWIGHLQGILLYYRYQGQRPPSLLDGLRINYDRS